ncbi:MAG: zinc-ribbon domain-containing protein [Archangium sp.]|nr:zinc-ribbon domain-containing protein [Archangium sp.]
MDVRCPRCQAEYDFDEARIPDDGLTVKCVQCNHVFRVKRREATELPPPSPTREWKVRQPATGNTFSCRELTTLQKWIVEGKIGRDDEISLTGDTWKRLGNIPELASFFQVVDEAAKARAYEAIRSATAPPPMAPPPPPAASETWKGPQFSQLMQQHPPAPPPPSVPPPDVPAARAPSPAPELSFDDLPTAEMASTRSATSSKASRPSRIVPSDVRNAQRRPSSMTPPDEDELTRAVQRSNWGWGILVVLGLAVGGAAGWYALVYMPEQQRLADEHAAAEQLRLKKEEETKRAEAEAKAKADAEAKAKADAEAAAQAVDAGPPAVVAVAEPVDAGVAAPPKPKAEPKLDFDGMLAKGESLLSAEKPEQAMSMFGRAADLRPDRVEPMVGRGLALLDMGNALAAQASFEQALRLNGRYGPAIMGLAEAYRAQKKNDKAIEAYEKYLDVMPEGSEANVARNNIQRLKK